MPENQELMNNKNGEYLAWQVAEYPHYEHSFWWYAGLIIVSLGLLIYALWTHNLLFAFIIVMFVIVFWIHSGREPAKLKFALTMDGVILGERKYPWKNFERFYIIYEPPEIKTLYLQFSGLRPHLCIFLEDKNPVEVRKILLQFLKEDMSKTEEPISDWIGRLFKI